MARDVFDLWHLVYLRRIGFTCFVLAPRPNLPRAGDPDVRVFGPLVVTGWSTVRRARRQWTRANLSPLSEAQGRLTMADGTSVRPPSGDETVPKVRQGYVSLNALSGSADSASKSVQARRDNPATTNAQTPKRSSGALNALSSQRARESSEDRKVAEENAFRARHRIIPWVRVSAFAVNLDDFEPVARSPVMGRPVYESLYGADGPAPHLEGKAFAEVNFRALSHTHSFIRQQGVDPISAASVAVGSTNVPQCEFGLLRENMELERPPADSQFQA